MSLIDTIKGTYRLILRGSLTGPVLDVLLNGHLFESPQGYQPKARPCDYRDTYG
jgi:hypothetical protein